MKENFNEHAFPTPQFANYSTTLCISMVISHSLSAQGDHSLCVSFSFLSSFTTCYISISTMFNFTLFLNL